MKSPLKPLAEEFYEPVSPAAVCGPELERYEFAELNESCTRKEGEWDSFHKKNIGGSDPNYRLARAEAMSLLERTRDFRVLARLPVIEAHVNGAPGLHAALHLLVHYFEEKWEAAHPQIVDGNTADRQRVFGVLPNAKETRLGIESSVVFKGQGTAGDVTIRSFLLSAGKTTAQDREFVWPENGLVEEIQRSTALKALEDTSESLEAAADLCDNITERLSKVFERPPNLSGLSKELRKFGKTISEFAEKVGGETAAFDTESGSEPAEAQGAGPALSSSFGAMETFADAEAELDEVIGYYARLGRPSPVPLILLKLKDMRKSAYSGWQRTLAMNGVEGAALEFGDVDPSRLETFAAIETGTDQSSDSAAKPAALDGIVERIDEAIEKHSALDGASPEAVLEIANVLKELRKEIDLHARSLSATDEMSTTHSTASGGLKGSVNDRKAVINILERVAVFLERAEPADPRPMLLRRAKSLVERNFLDTIRELAPNGGEGAQLRLEEPTKG